MTSSATRFSDALPLVVDVHGGIDNARQAVLSLAVAGRLVPQVSREGRGHDVLAKTRLQRDGQDVQGRSLNRKRDETASDDQAADPSFEIPGNWCWARLGGIAVKLGAGSTPLGGKSVYKRSGIKFLRSQNVWDSGLRLDDVAFIDQETHQRMEGTHVRPGDLLLNITGASIGRCAVVPDDFDEGNVSQHVAIVRLVDRDLRAFVHLCLISPYFQALIMGVQVGVSREGLSMKRLQDLQVPIPPVMEQKRIVAKVDQLMALCDDLEAKQTKKRDLATQSTRSALTALTTAETAGAREAAWHRLASQFSTLVADPGAAQGLRDAVLDLAVRGHLSRHGTGSREELQTPDEMAPFALPPTWRWISVGDAFDVVGGIQKTPARTPGKNACPYLRVENVQRGRLDLSRMEMFELQPGELERWRLEPDDLLIIEGNGSQREIGRCALWRGEVNNCVHQNHIIRCRPQGPVWSEFAILFLNSPTGTSEMRARAVTTSGLFNLSVGRVRGVPLPVPPLDEQRSIVAKVNQLMALCDDLEAKLRKQEETATRLAESLAAAVAA
jgi:type I restriction enzyme S subunit